MILGWRVVFLEPTSRKVLVAVCPSGLRPLFVSAEETVCVMTGSCVCLYSRQTCVWCVSWYQHYQVHFIVAPAPWPCPAKYFARCCVLVQCVFYVVSVCQSCTWHLPDGNCSIADSANTGLQLTTHPPQSSAHSPLLRTLKATLSLSSDLKHPFFFLFFTLSIFLFTAENQSVQNLFNDKWLPTCGFAIHVCAYVHRGSRTWNGCSNKEGPSWVWTDDPLLWPFLQTSKLVSLNKREKKLHFYRHLCQFISLSNAEKMSQTWWGSDAESKHWPLLKESNNQRVHF